MSINFLVDESRGMEEATAFKYFHYTNLWRDKLVSPMDSQVKLSRKEATNSQDPGGARFSPSKSRSRESNPVMESDIGYT